MSGIGEILSSAASSLINIVSEKKAYLGTAIVLLLVNLAIDTNQWWPKDLRFYHPGWVTVNRKWLLLPLVVALASLYICRKRAGFIIVVLACLFLAVFFGYAYETSQFSEGDWPFIVWLSYRVFLALLVGLGAALVDHFVSSTPEPSKSSSP